jgi:FKBP-type peptidyl-prolyl cis-trans isomerase
LTEFAQKPDVVTLDSGLMYVVEKEGDGASPASSDSVKVHYRGTTVDGTEFDSSYERGEPVEFQVDRVIPGWTEALQLMQEGDKWQLAIPADLAYGSQGRGGIIPPEAALIFDVELLEVTSAPEDTE